MYIHTCQKVLDTLDPTSIVRPYDYSERQKAWSFVEIAVCISLRERDDRAVQATKEFVRVGLDSKVVFYRPEKDKSTHTKRPTTRGCWESHRLVSEWLSREGYGNALIFEDDVHFDSTLSLNTLQTLKQAYTTLPKEWSIFFLGHFCFQWSDVSFSKHVKRVHSTCLHAYMINGPMMQWLATKPYDTVAKNVMFSAIDTYIMTRPHCYAFHPMICFQSSSKSDTPRSPTNLVTVGLQEKWMKRSPSIAKTFSTVAQIVAVTIVVALIVIVLQRNCKKKCTVRA